MSDEADERALARIKEYLDAGHSLGAIRQAGWGDWMDRLEAEGYDLRTGQRALDRIAPPAPLSRPPTLPADSGPQPTASASQAPESAGIPTDTSPAFSRPPTAPANGQPPTGSVQFTASLPLIESDIRRRVDTDRYMSFGSYILWILALSLFTAGIGTAVYIFIIEYQLVERRNQHFARQRSFYANVLRVLREKAEISGRQQAMQSIERVQAQVNDANVREGGDRNPWLWAVILPVLTLGIASLYTWWFLTVDFRRHSVRQREISDAVNEALRDATGRSNIAVVDESVTPERNYWVFLLLTVLTLGLFRIYWQYVIFNDANIHFARQAIAEDQLVSYLRVAG